MSFFCSTFAVANKLQTRHMKKIFIFLAAAMLFNACGMLNGSSSKQSSTATQSTQTVSTSALQSGQGAGNALQALYTQYKADGNKYDYKNMQNVLNTVTLLANCEGLKSNYQDKTYLKEFGKGRTVRPFRQLQLRRRAPLLLLHPMPTPHPNMQVRSVRSSVPSAANKD